MIIKTICLWHSLWIFFSTWIETRHIEFDLIEFSILFSSKRGLEPYVEISGDNNESAENPEDTDNEVIS